MAVRSLAAGGCAVGGDDGRLARRRLGRLARPGAAATCVFAAAVFSVGAVAVAGARPTRAGGGRPRPVLRWGQTKTAVSVVVEPPRGAAPPGCGPDAGVPLVEVEAVAHDRITFSVGCPPGRQVEGDAEVWRWSLELREDVDPDASRVEALPGSAGSGGKLVTMRKRVSHRWDRLLWSEEEASVSKDWKREDRNLPEEDEVELPRAQNIKRLTFDKLLSSSAEQVVVVAMRYTWCSLCEEKDKAFVKVAKVVGGKDGMENVLWGVLDLREEKAAARRFVAADEDGHVCVKDHCPLHVFKPDEPFAEPYRLEVSLLYEMDEMSMMGDAMAGAPGHTPRGQNAKPNFDAFENGLRLLLPPALTAVASLADVEELQLRWDNVVVATAGVNATAFRRAGRDLRGIASFARLEQGSDLPGLAVGHNGAGGEAAIGLWAATATPARTPIRFNGTLEPLDAGELQRFARVHSQPLLQNYSWDIKGRLDGTGLAIAVLWVNFSNSNSTNLSQNALDAFTSLCDLRRGTDPLRNVLCVVMDHSYAYYQREYGTHEPYPFPFFGVTRKLGFGEGDRFGFPFKGAINETVRVFFRSPKRAARELGKWVGRVLSGRVEPSHESGTLPAQEAWVPGEVQEVVWRTFQREVNGSTADILLEIYDDQRKKSHLADATMRIVAATLKDYSNLKVARMEASQNFVPPPFGRKQFAKETEYYWVPPSIASGQWSPGVPVKYAGEMPATPGQLLRFLKKHSVSHWSLKEALEAADDISAEVMSQANADQREVDRADQEKQQMIKKMMTSLKKEKGLVDVGEMMGLKKAADALGDDAAESAGAPKAKERGKTKARAPKATTKKSASGTTVTVSPVEAPSGDKQTSRQEQQEARRLKLQREEKRLQELERKEKEKRKRRREEEKKKKALKRQQEAEAQARAAVERELKRKERELLPTNASFRWGQSKESVRLSVSIPDLDPPTLALTLSDDHIAIAARDIRNRSFTLSFELREFVDSANSTHTLRYSEENPLDPKVDGVNVYMRKAIAHRWDRLAQNHAAVKQLMRKDWVQDDGELEEEKEDVDLPSGANLKKVTAATLTRLAATSGMVVAALRYPWCDKCAEKDRHFAKAARTSVGKDHLDSVTFVVIDAREEKHFARRHNYSCSDRCELLIFKQDEPDEPYTVPGRLYSEEVHIDCYKHLLPVVSVVDGKEQFTRVTSAFDTAIVGFFRRKKGEDPWYERYRAVARDLRGRALFGAIFGGREPREFGIESDSAPTFRLPAAVDAGREDHEDAGADGEHRPLVLLFKPKESRHVEFREDLTLERLTHFSKVLSLPLISTYDFEMRQKFQELKVPMGMMWLDAERPDRAENRQADAILQRLATRFSGHLVFVRLNSTRDAFLMRPMALNPQRAPVFGIAASEEPEAARFGFEMLARDEAERAAFWADEDRAFARLESFCASFLEGTLEASRETAELPPSYRWPGPGYVDEVVWKSFREAVYRTEHDVLLELYSPFRPQHRTYRTVLDLIAEALRDVSGLKVARMGTADNYVLPEFGLSDKEKASSFYFIPAAPERHRRPRRFGGRGGKAEALPEKILRFLHREMREPPWDLDERIAWVNREAAKRIKRLRALEKDYEKKMQDEWMQKELEEFERYKRLGKFDNLPMS